MTEPQDADLSFEEALSALEQIVTKLERGDVPLAQAIDLYERGAKLRAQCEKRLSEARMRVEAIRLSENGSPTGTEPFSA